MKAVILAGGLGTRLSEETSHKPKPMVEIGNKPIIWHIMKMLSTHGIKEFIICCGYKGSIIKEYFENYSLLKGDVMFDLEKKSTEIVSDNHHEDWTVLCVETGESTLTGGRIKKIKKYLKHDEPFLLTYGDGVGNINISELVKFHNGHKKLATVTAVKPPSRFGVLAIQEDGAVESFNEKPKGSNAWINGGFFVMEPDFFKYIDDVNVMLEREPIEKATLNSQLYAYKHEGFWQCMDNKRDYDYLESEYNNNPKWIKSL